MTAYVVGGSIAVCYGAFIWTAWSHYCKFYSPVGKW